MIIKVCGLKDTENVNSLLQSCSPDMLGMIFYSKSPRFIGESVHKSNFFSSQGQDRVGVFVDSAFSEILKTVQEFQLDVIQLHGNEDADFVKNIKEALDVKVIKVFRIGKELRMEDLRPFDGLADYFLFDTETSSFGGSGRRFDWQLLEAYDLQTPYLLSGGIASDDVGELVELQKKHPKMAGIDINSKFELEPGIKDVELVKTFVEKLRAQENEN
ncbi:phosphoribosylanthranilate isomerase [Litoribacter ruber]|uniref:phosphoribosylanthranilate isomerase n=1 Tax=Litoribacter ruber TaxID=702568 RepID=UPI001BDB5556|nr:phosphoribosylanthranilate isomerase [Litoribacter ruber]MBT0812946.1 phosphoribosylanthranilate isomerase [Litoribacter ruber]